MTQTQNIIVGTLVGAFLFSVALFVLAAPQPTHAATYAYVNQSGEVSMVIANDPMTAIATAVGRAVRSGVILLTGANGGLVGDHVTGS